MASADARRLLPLNDAAAMLGMSRRTLDRRIAAGEIAVFRDRRIVAVPSAEIARYVAAHVGRVGSVGRRRPRSAPTMAPGERLWD
jgi:predicted DNA-binding transcriptional regulator AlpA